MASVVPMKVQLSQFDCESAVLSYAAEPLKIEFGNAVETCAQSPCAAAAKPASNAMLRESSVSTAASGASDTASDSELSDLPMPKPVQGAQTTLMIRNVPVLYSKEMLLAEWPNDGSYDFFHLPWNTETQRNLSYAFMNFTSEAAALRFVQKWQKQRLPHYNSRKPLNLSFADVQGLAENLRALQKKRVNLDQCQAVVFESGKRVCLHVAMAAALKQGSKKLAMVAKQQQATQTRRQQRAVAQQHITISEGQVFSV